MKVKIRRSSQEDSENIYNLHTKCFSLSDQWYRSAIKQYLDKGIVIEDNNKNIIGVLLQGNITPCNQRFTLENTTEYKEDIFEPVNETGEMFLKNNIHYKDLYGIVMICIDPNYRGKGLAKKLIEKHFQDNKGSVVCLNTRRTNSNAFELYKKMGYEHIAYIKNKYFQPNEDSIFMIKDLS